MCRALCWQEVTTALTMSCHSHGRLDPAVHLQLTAPGSRAGQGTASACRAPAQPSAAATTVTVKSLAEAVPALTRLNLRPGRAGAPPHRRRTEGPGSLGQDYVQEDTGGRLGPSGA